MSPFQGKTLSFNLANEIFELRLHRQPCNEIGSLTLKELEGLSDENDVAASKNSLDATLIHWRDGRSKNCREWLQELLVSVTPLAEDLNLVDQLAPLHSVLDRGIRL